MTGSWPVLLSAFLTGLLGSAHCLAMCSGISGLATLQAGASTARAQAPLALAYNAGRVTSYAIFGALVGAAGSAVVLLAPSLAAPVRILSGAVIIAIGMQYAFQWRLLAPLENAGARIWRHVRPAARWLLPVDSLPSAFGLGLLWGLLPCGLVYSALMIAATTATPAHGALAMLAFGSGTLPAMIATGLGSARLAAAAGRNRRALGLLLVALGAATIVLPLSNLMSTAGHVHH